ncbi:MAG: hypothetical protein IT175_06095 [Acidobacteria bacterium]|nr:hypothetical protein [Acidobacteriota bacterium]
MTTVLVLGAGGPAGVNFIRSLRAASDEYRVIAADSNSDHLPLAAEYADMALPCPRDQMGLLEWVTNTQDEWAFGVEVDVIYAAPDRLALWLADHAELLPCAALVPSRRTVALCQDKFAAGIEFRRAGLREDYAVEIDNTVNYEASPALTEAAHKLGFPFWLRARFGAGSRASTLAPNMGAAVAWLDYWRFAHGSFDFLAEQYLPGRDFAWCSIWADGELVAAYARERVEHLYGHLTPSGRTSTPSVARIVADEAVHAVGRAAVLAVDDHPHGIFSVDLREDADRVPRPTEINAGRLHTTSLFGARTGCNLPHLYCQLALGRDVAWREPPHGALWLRHVDCNPVLVATPAMVVA